MLLATSVVLRKSCGASHFFLSGLGREGQPCPNPRELKADKDVAGMQSATELEALFDCAYHTRHVDTIFRRLFGVG